MKRTMCLLMMCAWLAACGGKTRAYEAGLAQRSLTLTGDTLYATQLGLPEGVLARYGERLFRVNGDVPRAMANHAASHTLAILEKNSVSLMDTERGLITGELMIERELPGMRTNGVAISPSGAHVVTLSNVGRYGAVVWDRRTKRPIQRVVRTGARGYDPLPVVSSAADEVAVRDFDVVRILELSSARPRIELEIPRAFRSRQSYGAKLAYARDGERLAMVTYSGFVVWDVASGSVLIEKIHSRRRIADVALDAGDGPLAVSRDNGHVELWEAPFSRPRLLKPRISGSDVMEMSFVEHPEGDAPGEVLLVGYERRSVRLGAVSVWPTDPARASDDGVTEVMHSIDAHMAAAADGNEVWIHRGNTVLRALLPALDVPREVRGHAASIRGMHFDEEGREFVSVDRDGVVYLWDVERHSGRAIARDRFVSSSVSVVMGDEPVCFGRVGGEREGEPLVSVVMQGSQARELGDTSVLVAAAADSGETWRVMDTAGNLHVFDKATAQRLARYPIGGGRTARVLAMTPSLDTVLILNVPSPVRGMRKPATMRLMDTQTGKILSEFSPKRSGARTRCAMRDDGRHIACTLDGRSVVVYDRSGEELQSFNSSVQGITELEFLPGGRSLAVLSYERRADAVALEVYSLAEPEFTHFYTRPRSGRATMGVHPDGRRIFLGFSDGIIHALDLRAVTRKPAGAEVEF